MCRFIESIRLENGKLSHLEWHQKRLDRTRRNYFADAPVLSLERELKIPENLGEGLYKCRLVYGKDIEDLSFQPYEPRLIRTLRLVYDDTVLYPWKSTDRHELDKLMLQRNGADDVLIVQNGSLTDTSFSNLALWDGKRWYTPDTPLLRGTCRERLLAEGVLAERSITTDDLPRFREVRLINAMIGFVPDSGGGEITILPAW